MQCSFLRWLCPWLSSAVPRGSLLLLLWPQAWGVSVPALKPQCGVSLGFPVLLGHLGMSRASQGLVVHVGGSDGILDSSPQRNTSQTHIDVHPWHVGHTPSYQGTMSLLCCHLPFGVPARLCLPSL